MTFDVVIYQTMDSPGADIRVSIPVADPIEAAFTVMGRFGIRRAFHVLVFQGIVPVGDFVDVEAASPSIVPGCSVSYDYGL